MLNEIKNKECDKMYINISKNSKNMSYPETFFIRCYNDKSEFQKTPAKFIAQGNEITINKIDKCMIVKRCNLEKCVSNVSATINLSNEEHKEILKQIERFKNDCDYSEGKKWIHGLTGGNRNWSLLAAWSRTIISNWRLRVALCMR